MEVGSYLTVSSWGHRGHQPSRLDISCHEVPYCVPFCLSVCRTLPPVQVSVVAGMWIPRLCVSCPSVDPGIKLGPVVRVILALGGGVTSVLSTLLEGPCRHNMVATNYVRRKADTLLGLLECWGVKCDVLLGIPVLMTWRPEGGGLKAIPCCLVTWRPAWAM